MSNGTSLVTRGLIGGAGSAETPVETSTDLPAASASPPTTDVEALRGEFVVVIPTAPNMLLMAAENVLANLRVGQPASLEMPSLFQRARLIAHETSEIVVFRERK